MTFAELLKRHRRRAGLSQLDLATRAGVSQSCLSRVERGFWMPSADVRRALAAALGVPATVFLRAGRSVRPVPKARIDAPRAVDYRRLAPRPGPTVTPAGDTRPTGERVIVSQTDGIRVVMVRDATGRVSWVRETLDIDGNVVTTFTLPDRRKRRQGRRP